MSVAMSVSSHTYPMSFTNTDEIARSMSAQLPELFILQALLSTFADTLLQSVAHPLRPASQGIDWNAKPPGQRLPIVDFAFPFVFVIVEYQQTAVSRQVAQAPFKTIASNIGLFKRRTGCAGFAQIVQAEAFVLGISQGFEEDHPRDAMRIRGDIADRLAALELPGDAVESLVNTFFREMRSAPVEELHQLQSKHFVSLTCALFVGVQTGKKLRERFLSQCPLRPRNRRIVGMSLHRVADSSPAGTLSRLGQCFLRPLPASLQDSRP